VRQLDPLCAEMCASREDRAVTVIPQLQQAHEKAVASVDDFTEFVTAMRHFHEMMLRCCGNRTLELFIGTLESLWYAHEEEWAARTVEDGHRPAPEATQRSLDDHAELIAAIAAGNRVLAAMLARRHQEYTQPMAGFGDNHGDGVVDAQLVRPLDPERGSEY
jgi:GntR family transcriptional repressor for pyruvate dehydrogenase complex